MLRISRFLELLGWNVCLLMLFSYLKLYSGEFQIVASDSV